MSDPAAFGRLRVETKDAKWRRAKYDPAAFGRLRVETVGGYTGAGGVNQPPSGGCVLKHGLTDKSNTGNKPAAFGRLRVETAVGRLKDNPRIQPPSGGCVLKRTNKFR